MAKKKGRAKRGRRSPAKTQQVRGERSSTRSSASREAELRARIRELEDDNQRYRSLFEHHSDAVYAFDLEGRFTSANEVCVQLSGYEKEELLGMSFMDLIVPEDRGLAWEIFEKALAGEPQQYALAVTHKQGHRIELSGTSLPIIVNGRVVGIYGVARDVTEEKRLEEQLRHSQKMEAIGRLAGGIAHDFNNLLMAILGHTQLLLSEGGAADPQREGLLEVQKAAERAASLTRQLLMFSRRQVLQPSVLDLNEVVSNMDRMLRRLIGEDVELVTRLDPKVGRVRADRSQIEQVILNLAVNARDAMPEGGTLSIETVNVRMTEAPAGPRGARSARPYAALVVGDTGVGMDGDVRAHLFEPFFTTKPDGTGLGLSTVYGIVQESGGRISVQSELGRGATFRIALPHVAETGEPEARGEAPGELPAGTETILLVEDEESVRKVLRSALERSGYTVLEAEDGQDALERWGEAADSIHLLVTDLVMPRLGGRGLAERLAARRPDLPVVYISGYAAKGEGSQGWRPDAPFLQKPFAAETLLRAVRRALDGG